MEPTSRRQFLQRSSAVAAAAGVAAVVPASAAKALTKHVRRREPEPKLPDDSVGRRSRRRARASTSARDSSSLYTGEREITIKNRRLAAALYHATH